MMNVVGMNHLISDNKQLSRPAKSPYELNVISSRFIFFLSVANSDTQSRRNTYSTIEADRAVT